jgi:glycerol-3-phosphate dehydrogenase
LAYDWLGQATSMPNLGQHFGHGLTEAEVHYLVDREWAINAEDILWRRTKLGLRFTAMEQATLETFLAHK